MGDEHDGTVTLSGAVRALTMIVLGDSSMDAVLHRTCDVTKAAIRGVADVSVTVLEPAGPRTAAATGELAVRIDHSQYAAGAGPCLEAARTGAPVIANDLGSDSRWADYATAAVAAGVGSSLSIPLRADDGLVGALNIYATQPATFDPDAVDGAIDLASYAGVVLTNADHYYRATALAAQLQRAMESRAIIEQAKGILMAQRRCRADEAFGSLVRLSQETHRKLRDVAAALVDQTVE